jgi:hypothetical protein
MAAPSLTDMKARPLSGSYITGGPEHPARPLVPDADCTNCRARLDNTLASITPMGQVPALCNTCGGTRNHELLRSEQSAWEIESFDLRGIDTFEMLRCAGCGEIKLRHTKLCDDERTTTYFPPGNFRPIPRWFDKLWEALPPGRESIHALLREIYVALASELFSLAAMGIRAVIERAMIERCGDSGSFIKNLANLESNGLIARTQREHIEMVLEVGHAAIHRTYSPTRDDLSTLLDITESLLQGLYLHPESIADLKKRVPKRTARPKNAG